MRPIVTKFRKCIYRQGEPTKPILSQLLQNSGCYGFLKLSLAYNGKIEKQHLLLCHGRHFDKTFSDMFLVKSSTKHIIFHANYSIWLVVVATKMHKFVKILKKKKNSLDAIWPMKLKLCRNVLSISLYKNTLLIVVAKALWLLWQLKFSIDFNGKLKNGIYQLT